MSAYLNSLRQEVAAAKAPTTSSLEARVTSWFSNQPEVSRFRPYSMREIEQGTGIAGRFLGEVLIKLGWTRHRRWSSKSSYRRYWLPVPRDSLNNP